MLNIGSIVMQLIREIDTFLCTTFDLVVVVKKKVHFDGWMEDGSNGLSYYPPFCPLLSSRGESRIVLYHTSFLLKSINLFSFKFECTYCIAPMVPSVELLSNLTSLFVYLGDPQPQTLV